MNSTDSLAIRTFVLLLALLQMLPDLRAEKREPLPLPDKIEPLPTMTIPEKATAAQLEDAKNQRQAALEDLRKTQVSADASYQEATVKINAAKLEKTKREKELILKRTTLTPLIQQTETLETERKKCEKEVVNSLAAAAEAAKVRDAAKQKLDDLLAQFEETRKARQEAEHELEKATSELTGLDTKLTELSQSTTEADAHCKQVRLSQQQAEQDLQRIVTAGTEARRAETEAIRHANQGKITAIEKQIQDMKLQVGKLNAALGPLKELGDAGKEAMKKIEDHLNASTQQMNALQAELKRLSGDTEDPPIKVTGIAEPTVFTSEIAQTDKSFASETKGVTNSLGMKFVSLGDVQFSVYLTTRKDFEAFATATKLRSDAWRNPGFLQDPTHPVVNVTWIESEAFCKWLTEKERKSGLLKTGQSYRLPTDAEWSKAVGLPFENGRTPEERDMKMQDKYPWGNQWPPPQGAGNYAGEETLTDVPIPSYNDGYAQTSPVGKFGVNEFGLYDMGGNVWQWVSDSWSLGNRAKVLRGSSWENGSIPLSLLSSCRISASPEAVHDTYGFRIVKSAELKRLARRK